MHRGLPQPGALVAEKYVISRLLGRGGMGAVYVVEHRYTGKRLALKCLLPEHLEQPEFIERFLREAQAAGRIQHRNVVDVFDVGQDGELIYIVMELLDGKPLGELLRDDQLGLEEVLQIVLRAMEGVAAAHKEGIVHRDLKPDNIFVCVGQSGRLDDPRVLDFGISKLEDDVSSPLTRSGVMLGTPYYMAFEQINSQRDLDQRVDIYAMGVILYEAMAGQPPYAAESVGALAIRMMTAPPVPLGSLRPELPEGLADVVMRAIARDRQERYPSMQAFVDALRPYANDPAQILVPRGHGTPLRSSVRASLATDATLPAMQSLTPTSSDRRLKLDQHDDAESGRSGGRLAPSQAVDSSRTLLIVGGVALVAIVMVSALTFALRSRDDAITTAPAEEIAPAATPAAPSTPPPEAVPAQAAPPSSPASTSAPTPAPPAEPAPLQPSQLQPTQPSAVETVPPGADGAQPRARAALRRRARERLIPSGELLMAPDATVPEAEGVPPVEAPPTLPPDLQPTEAQAPPTAEAQGPPDPEPTPQAEPPAPPVTPQNEPTPEPAPAGQ